MERGAWRATVHGAAKQDTTERITLSTDEKLSGMVYNHNKMQKHGIPTLRLGNRWILESGKKNVSGG